MILTQVFLQDNKPKTLMSWESVAEGVEVLLKKQACLNTSEGYKGVGGGIFHPTKWYVAVGKCWPDSM